MKYILSRLEAAARLVVVGAALGYGAGPEPAALMKPDNVASCEGGTQNDLQLALTPLWVERGAAGEVLGLSLDAHTLFKSKAQAKLAVELVDDVGRPMMAPIESPRLRMLPGAEGVQALEFKTPDKLEDGYYKVRATGAAISADSATAENIVQMYLLRARGELFTISYEEYVTSSRAQMEVAVQ